MKNLNTELAKHDPNKQVWVTIHHEPETDEPSAGFAPMQDRLLPLPTAPNIRTWIILCGWHETFDPRKIYTFEMFWPKVANRTALESTHTTGTEAPERRGIRVESSSR